MNSDLVGVDFKIEEVTYRVSKVLNDVAYASKVNSDTGKTRKGRPSRFNVQRVRLLTQEAAKVEQPTFPGLDEAITAAA